MRNRDERGFSLIELMVAMAVTLVVTGAIYGLMAGGQNAFRREPEMTDRQQNVRLAMDLIMRDVAAAGTSMPEFLQTFRTGLNSCAECPLAPNGGDTPGGTRTDDIEIVSNPLGLAQERGCGYDGQHSQNARVVLPTTGIGVGDAFMILLADGTWAMRGATDEPKTNHGALGNCAAAEHGDFNFNSGAGDTTGYNIPGGVCAGNAEYVDGQCVGCSYDGQPIPGNACCSPTTCEVVAFLKAQVVRYRVRPGDDNVPNLERVVGASTQVIARGIDDLQVIYTTAAGATAHDAPIVDQTQLNYGSLIRNVTVTLSSRTDAPNLAGVRTVAVGPTAMRGQLVSTVTPRAVLDTLNKRTTDRSPGWTGPTWY